MRRFSLIVIVTVSLTLTTIAGCGDDGPPDSSFNDGRQIRRLPNASPGSQADVDAALALSEQAAGTMDERRERLLRFHGADRSVRVRVIGCPAHASAFILRELSKAADTHSFREETTDGSISTVYIPLVHIDALADRIDFAETVEVDTQQRVVTVHVDLAKLPPPSRALQAQSPNHPDAQSAIHVELTCGDPQRARRMLKELEDIEPGEMREEIAEAIEALLLDENSTAREQALVALGVWSTKDIGPALISALDDRHPSIRVEAITQLTDLNDLRAAERIAELYFHGDPSSVRAAGAYFRQVQAAAQAAVAPYAKHHDYSVRTHAIELLVEIGRPDTVVPVLVEALRDKKTAVRDRALAALGELRDPRGVEPVAEMLGTNNTSIAASLVAMGPMAEEAVIQRLAHGNVEAVTKACAVLEKIGTEKSVPSLLILAQCDRGSINVYAKKAGQAIVERHGISLTPDAAAE